MMIYGVEVTARPGHAGDLGAVVTDLRANLGDVTGEQWSAWAEIGRQEYGSFMLSTRVAGVEQLVAMRQAAGENDAFAELSKRVGDLVASTATEYVNQVVHVAGTPPEPPAPVVMVTTARMQPGHYRAGGAFAVEVMDHVHGVTGRSGMVAVSSMGPMGQVTWLASASEPGEVDQATEALNNDAKYLEMVDEGGSHFVAGMSERGLLVQLP